MFPSDDVRGVFCAERNSPHSAIFFLAQNHAVTIRVSIVAFAFIRPCSDGHCKLIEPNARELCRY